MSNPQAMGLLWVSCEQGFGSVYVWVALRDEVGIARRGKI